MSLYDNRATTASMGRIIDFSTLTSRTQKQGYEDNGNDNNNYNNYPGARARVRAREGMTAEMDEMRDLYDLYCDTFGRDRVAAIVRREMAEAIEAGAEPSLIAYAIEMAEAAPSPSWAYARAVMRKCMSDNCRTYDDCEARADRVRARRSERRGQEYAQREVKDDDFDQIFNRFLTREKEEKDDLH